MWTERTRSLFLRLPAGAVLAFKPGQFVSVELPVDGGEPLVRAYSLASSPEDGKLLEICVDLVPGGPVSTSLFALRPGDSLSFKGPFGTFVLDDPPATELVFVATGTGIAPIRPMVRRAVERGGTQAVRVLHGARVPEELVYRSELEGWARREPRLSWECFLAGRSAGVGESPPLEAAVAERYVRADAQRHRHFWICGVGAIVHRLRDLLREAGYERRAVRYERW